MAKRKSVQFATQQMQNLAGWLQQREQAETAKGFAERQMGLQEREGALQELLGKGGERRAKRGERRKGQEALREKERWGRESELWERGGMTPEQTLQGQGGGLLESMGGLGGIPLRDITSMAGVADLSATLGERRQKQAATERGLAPIGGAVGGALGAPPSMSWEQLGVTGAGPFAGLQGRREGIEAAAAKAAGGQASAWGPEDALRFQTNYRQAVETYLPIAFSTMRSANPELDARVQELQGNPMVSPGIEDYLALLAPDELQEVMRMSSDFAQMSFEQGVGAGTTFGGGIPQGAPAPQGGGGPIEGLGTGMPPELAPSAPPELSLEDLIGQYSGTLQDSLSAGGLHNMPGMGNMPQWQDPTRVGMPGLESGRTLPEFFSRAIAVARIMGMPEPTAEELFEEWATAQGRQEMISGEQANKRKKTPGGGGGAG
ncbi:MAG: hypothetical protein JRC86_09715 [Deltaproteobacteria bacterium]|nr:hypothetical protein [Deltaproteobacteria bacterium]